MGKAKKPELAASRDQLRNVSALVNKIAPLKYHVPHLRRTFDFDAAGRMFGIKRGEKIAAQLSQWFASGFARSTAIFRHINFSNLCNWCADYLRKHDLYSSIHSEMIDVEVFSEMLSFWFSTRKEKYGASQSTTCGEIVNAVNGCLKHLAKKAILPATPHMKMPANYHFTGGHKKSIIELQSINTNTKLIEKIYAHHNPNTADKEDLQRILRIFATQSPDHRSEEALFSTYRRLSTEYLQIVRNVAEHNFLKASELYDQGQALLRQANSNAAMDIDRGLKEDWLKARPVLHKHLPLSDPNISGPNLLAYCYFKNAGMAPSPGHFPPPQRSYLTRLYASLGGAIHIQKLLGGHPDASAAAALIYLVDSGANVSTAIILSPGCLAPTDDPNYTRVVSQKARAGWKPIVDSFDERDRSVRVTTPACLRKLTEMTSQIRKENPIFKNVLFLFKFFSEPSSPSNGFLSNRLKYFLRDANQSDKVIRLDSIRTTFLLRQTLSDDGDTRVTEILANHNEGTSTTKGYTEKWPATAMYQQLIRKFTDLLEADLIFNGLSLNEAFRIPKREAKKLLEEAHRTGYGVTCRNPDESPLRGRAGECHMAGVSCLDSAPG